MPDTYLIVDAVVIVALLGLGLAVLLRNNASVLNRVFAAFVLCVAVWIAANYISNDTNNPAKVATIANYFVFFFSYSAAYYLLRFAIVLAEDTRAQRMLRRIRVVSGLIAFTALTPLVVKGVELQGSVYAVTFGPLSWLYFATLVSLAAWVPYVLFVNIRSSRGEQKGRLEIIFVCLCLALPILILAEAILPAVTGWFGLTNIGVTPMLILVAGLYYSVARHRLFNLRLVIVRSLAYVATLGLILAVYGLISYYIAAFSIQLHNGFAAGLLSSLLVVLAALSYAPLQKVLDKVSNNLFYRDAYDPQLLLDELNQALVNNIILTKLLESCSEIVANNLKSQGCTIALRAEGADEYIKAGSSKAELLKRDLETLSSLVSKSGVGVTSIDDLPYHDGRLRKAMTSLDAALVAKLSPETSRSESDLSEGFILLKPKRSGNMYTSQDMQVLGIIANELSIAIQNALHFDEIQKFNITLQDEVDTATRKLKRQNKRLEELDNIKDDFISMASHQLRTPLTSVKGYLSMVLEGDAGKLNGTEEQMLKQAFTSSQRMVFLITDLLNVSRLKTGKFVIDAAPTNLKDVVEQELAQLRETATAKNLELLYTPPKTFPELMLDEVKIRQVIMNFVDNAIYYTPANGRIKVELEDKPSTIELRVVDNGIGVPKSEQHHLFTKFYRATNARTARPDGTGLGLFMAQKVVVAQGGSVIFQSREGQGSTFGFSFSKSRLAVKRAVAVPRQELIKAAPEPVSVH